MINIRLNPKVNEYISKANKWNEEFKELRKIILECELLTEEVKWNHPCYTLEGKNIVIMHGFKNYCALLFPKGVLLKDAHKILIQQTKNVQAARQIRFTNVQEIVKLENVLKEYIQEAIEVEKAGLKIEPKKTTEYKIPDELQSKFDEIPALKTAFKKLTPGRQRAYILYFSDAKQSKTRERRVERYIEKILDGKGLND